MPVSIIEEFSQNLTDKELPERLEGHDADVFGSHGDDMVRSTHVGSEGQIVDSFRYVHQGLRFIPFLLPTKTSPKTKKGVTDYSRTESWLRKLNPYLKVYTKISLIDPFRAFTAHSHAPILSSILGAKIVQKR